MLRFIWVIVSCLFLIMYYVPKMSYYARHPEKYGEDICYQMAQVMCNHVRRRALSRRLPRVWRTFLRRADISCMPIIRVSMMYWEL